MMKCIIVEDQRPAQKVLEKFIGDTPDLESIGVFSNALEAALFLKSAQVDLIFLDIHLPKLSGVDFLKTLHNPPQVIFTTAFPDYALDGFELNVVDYLLKPFNFSRFHQAINKLNSKDHNYTPSVQKVENIEKQDYYFAKLDRDLVKISFEDIFHIQASGDFVNIFFQQDKKFLSEGLKFWNDLLSINHFMKVHKSYIVNIKKIDKVSGNQIFINGHVIPIGRLYRKEFLKRIATY